MTRLTTLNFPNDIEMTRIFENRDLLDEFRSRSPEGQTLAEVRRIYGGETLFPGPYVDRPYTYCSLVCSLDGRIAFEDDPVSPLLARNNALDPEGGLLNFWSLMMQRTHADACLTAARTLQAEPEATLHICDQNMIRQRLEILGKALEHPLNIVVTRSAREVPLDHKIFHSLEDEHLHVLLVTSRQGRQRLEKRGDHQFRFIEIASRQDMAGIAELQEAYMSQDGSVCPVLVAGTLEEDIDTKLFLWILRQAGIGRLFVEAPQYMYHLIEEQLLDEFFVDFSMLFAGGSIIAGMGHVFQSTAHPHTEIVSVAMHKQNFLYTRQRLVYGS